MFFDAVIAHHLICEKGSCTDWAFVVVFSVGFVVYDNGFACFEGGAAGITDVRSLRERKNWHGLGLVRKRPTLMRAGCQNGEK